MTDPKRWLETGTDLEARLLASALDDAPGRSLERRVQAAVGLGGIAIGAGTASTAAAATSKAAPLLMSFGIAKWVGILAIGTGAAVGAAVVHHEVGSRKVSVGAAGVAGAVSPAVPVALATATRSRDAAPLPIPVIQPTVLPVSAPPPARVPAPPARPASASPSLPLPAEPTADLVSELALLDGAHRALDARDTPLALATLDRHDLEFVHGDLAPESLALRIEAYAQRHDDAKVRELAQMFLSRYPTHPQSRRVQSILDESTRP
jgi:hypothetical protein